MFDLCLSTCTSRVQHEALASPRLALSDSRSASAMHEALVVLIDCKLFDTLPMIMTFRTTPSAGFILAKHPHSERVWNNLQTSVGCILGCFLLARRAKT